MPDRTLDQTMEALSAYLDEFDQIARVAHARYRSYSPADLVEHDARAQAACTYAHMNADAERRFTGRAGIRYIDLNGQKLWHFEEANVVVRLKKMDENGNTRNYPTKQAKAFDRGYDLPGLPMPPVRLTAGYWLDTTGTIFERTQVARPMGRKRTLWCAALVPAEVRKVEERAWIDVTQQGHF